MKRIIALILFAQAFVSFAQQDEQMSMFLYNKLYLNPAYAGSRDALSTVAVARFQWVNFDGAPNTQWFSIHTPLLQNALGLGAHMVNDRIGSRSRTAIYADVSSGIAVNRKGSRISAGISGGFDIMGYDFSNVAVVDENDPYYLQTYSTVKPNIGAGLYYYGDKHYISVSVPRVMEAKENLSVDSILNTLNSRHYFISGGYVFDLNSVFKLMPSVLVKYTAHAPITVDANLSLIMYDKLTVGALYRYNEAVGINAMYNIKKTFAIGYFYDFPVNGLRTYQYGSHELFLRYDFRPKKSTYTSPRYF